MKWIIIAVMLTCNAVMGQDEFQAPAGLVARFLVPGFNAIDAVSGTKTTTVYGTGLESISQASKSSIYIGNNKANYMNLTTDPIPNNAQRFTICCWVYWSSPTDYSAVLANWIAATDVTTVRKYKMGCLGSSFYIDVSNTGNNDNYRFSNAIIPNNKWSHLAMVWDGPLSIWKLYINGKDQSGSVGGGSCPATIYNAPLGNAIIGHQANQSDGAGTGPFNRSVSDAQYYIRSLSDAEIMSICQQTRGNYK